MASRPIRDRLRADMRRTPGLDGHQLIIVFGAALVYAVLHWVFSVLPFVLPINDQVNLDIRPGVIVPLLVGLALGPAAGLFTGIVGRLLGDVLAGVGPSAGALLFSGLLGLAAGLDCTPGRNYREVRPLLTALVWIVLASAGTGLVATFLVQTLLLRQFSLAAGWSRAVSDMVSTSLNGVLLMPSALYLWAGRSRTTSGQR